MPQTKSHIKNIKVTIRNRNNNKKYKSAIKKAMKNYLASLKKSPLNQNQNNLDSCANTLSVVYKVIDKAVNKNVLHKNSASRKKSRLAKLLQS
uniref:Small ribosomal subunit protein bS20c n=1 Tax=Tolypiocladia glomerulata TaxID=860646 RepID=A0A1Z1MV55_9FLOR|nr:ribosomal protein S20 [Tolypiocladia glomerulata]ARW69742.1 ribosomal protein S20 [Tolypiocladia glomerulata]